ncbi:MAG TPA: EAL domain-containing protein [Beijerinckiaceae bacterium]
MEMSIAPWLLAGSALVLAAVAILRARRLGAQAAKLSSDLDAVSLRLVGLESAPRPAPAEPPDAASDAGLAEMTAEIGLIGEIVRDLALLKQAAQKPPRPAAAAAPARPAPAEAPPARPAEAPPIPKARPPEPPEAPGKSPAAAIVAAFEGERIELHLQPVVSLPQRKVRFYEALTRLRLADGTLLVPAEFLPVLEERGLMPDLDRKVLARSAAIVRHLATRGSEASIACNLSPASLAEPGFLRAVARLIEAHPDLPGRLVLELSQRCWRTLDAEKAGALAQLRDRGLVFALDRATDLRLDPLSLADRGVRFVKIPAEMLLAAEAPGGLDVELHDLAAVLSRAGIRLIAERVEREEDVPDLLELDVPMAQGFVFSPPRPLRAEVLSPAAPATPAPASTPVLAAAPPPTPAAEPPPAPEPPRRMPFRSFLRRAS